MTAAEEGLGDGFRKLDDLLLHLKALYWCARPARGVERRRASSSCTAWRSIACATSLRCS